MASGRWLNSALQGGGHPVPQCSSCPACHPESSPLALTTASPPHPAEHGPQRSRPWCPWRSWLGIQLGPRGSWHCMRSWGEKSRSTAFKPRTYSRKGSGWWTVATACPWRCEHSDESGAELGTQPHYPRPRNPRAGGEGQAGGRERGRDREGLDLMVFPRHVCWALQPGPTLWASHPRHPLPPGHWVSAGSGQTAAGAQRSLGPVPGTLRGALASTEAAARAGPG